MKHLFTAIITLYIMTTPMGAVAANDIKLVNGGSCSYYAYEKVKQVYGIELPVTKGYEYEWKALDSVHIANYKIRISKKPLKGKGLCLLSKVHYVVKYGVANSHIVWYDSFKTIGASKIKLKGYESSTSLSTAPQGILNGCWYRPISLINDKSLWIHYINFIKIPNHVTMI